MTSIVGSESQTASSHTHQHRLAFCEAAGRASNKCTKYVVQATANFRMKGNSYLQPNKFKPGFRSRRLDQQTAARAVAASVKVPRCQDTIVIPVRSPRGDSLCYHLTACRSLAEEVLCHQERTSKSSLGRSGALIP